MNLFRATAASVALLSVVAAFPSYGAEDEQPETIVYPLNIKAEGLDNYQSGFYYYNGRNLYNLRNFKIASGTDISTVKVSPAGSSFAYIDNRKGGTAVRVHDLWNTKKILGKIENDGNTHTALAYSPDARTLYVATASDVVLVYDTKTNSVVDRISIPMAATELWTSPDGYFLVGVNGPDVNVVNLDNKQQRASLPQSANVRDIAFNSDGSMMAVLTADGKCQVYDTRSFSPSLTYTALGEANGLSFHPEDKYLAVVTGQNRIALINTKNEKDREYVESDKGGIDYVNFLKNVENGIYLVYDTDGSVVFKPMFTLSPNRQKLLEEKLASRMEEWMKRMDGESLEDYNARVNEESRMAQMRLFETEIATEMAGDMLAEAQLTFGDYSPSMGMLTLELGNLPDIYLTIPQDQLSDFMNPGDLEFVNTRYFINGNDEFELAYTEIRNTKTGHTYVFDNTERKSLAFLEEKDGFIPFEQMQASMMEENLLEEIRNNVLDSARSRNVVSDHTNIDVRTSISSGNAPDGHSISNYIVDVSYTVDAGFSEKEDFPGGKYLAAESNAAQSMLEVLKQALTTEFAKYLVPGKKLTISTVGSADASRIRGRIQYKGEYGSFEREPVRKNGELTSITVTPKTGITDNDQLAFLRGSGVTDFIVKNIPAISEMDVTIEPAIEVSDKTGSEYRRIGVRLTFTDAF